jgi:acetyltransferase-like isoleucine patch superfamily enzyme
VRDLRRCHDRWVLLRRGNATVRDKVTVGVGCLVGAGALIVSDREPGGVDAAPATPRRLKS